MDKQNMIKSSTLIKNSKLKDIKEKFDFIRIIGNGGYGKVRLCKDKELNSMSYAMKTLKKDIFNEKSIRYIKDEIKALRDLDHPNIVKYYCTYEDDYFVHILMEYVPGDDLFKVITEKLVNSFTEHDAAEIINHLLKAVRFLHYTKIIHRDIKPENILFSIPGKVYFYLGNYQSLKLIDFGLSTETIKSQDLIVGSLHYLAPESLDGHYSFKNDSWSIGVVLFVMMTGIQPFEGKSRQELLEKIKNFDYNKSAIQNAKISEEVKDLIMNLMQKDIEKRYDINKALNHPWIIKFTKKTDCKILGEEIINSLKSFTLKNLFQKEVLYYYAKLSNENEIQKIKNFFLEIDTDNTGTIEYEEVIEAFKMVGLKIDNVM